MSLKLSEDTTDTQNGERLKTKLYGKRDDFTLTVVNPVSSVAIFQHHQCMEFTFHNSYVIRELVPSTAADTKAT